MEGSDVTDVTAIKILEITSALLSFVARAQPIKKHLFDGFVVGHENVTNSVSAHKMANFLGKVLHVVAGTFQRLGHEDDLEAGLPSHILRVLNMPQEDQIPPARPGRCQ